MELGVSPKPLRYGRDWIGFEYIEGRIPEKIDLKRLAELLRKIHSVRVKVGDWKKFLRRKFEKKIEILKEVNKELYEFFRKKFLRIIKEYGDICKDNIIEDKSGRYFLIDWEDSTFGEPYYDLALFGRYYGNIDLNRVLEYYLLISLKKALK